MSSTPPPLPAAPSKKKNGCLIGCAIAAGIVPILAALLFPAISAAVDSARATAVKQRMHGIWFAIMSANAEREDDDLPPLWPGDLAKQDITFTTAEDYFTYLMSDGVNTSVIEPNPEKRLVPRLHPIMFSAHGVPGFEATGVPLPPENNAWHVVAIYDNSPPEIPFLVSRNAKASDLAHSTADDDGTIALNQKTKPFGSRQIVWGRKGGACMSARSRYATRARLFPVEKPEDEPALNVLPAQHGFQ